MKFWQRLWLTATVTWGMFFFIILGAGHGWDHEDWRMYLAGVLIPSGFVFVVCGLLSWTAAAAAKKKGAS